LSKSNAESKDWQSVGLLATLSQSRKHMTGSCEWPAQSTLGARARTDSNTILDLYGCRLDSLGIAIIQGTLANIRVSLESGDYEYSAPVWPLPKIMEMKSKTTMAMSEVLVLISLVSLSHPC